MYRIKMIVMDLDDTLLTDELTIGEYTKYVIANAQRNGLKIVIASGRPTPAIMPYAQELKLAENGGFVISYNGAVLTDCARHEHVFKSSLTFDNIDFLCRWAKQNDTFIHTYVDGEILTPKNNKHTEFEGELTGMPVREVKDLRAAIHAEVVKILLLDEPDALKAKQERLRPLVGDTMNMNISKPFFLEFTNKAVDKSKTIDVLVKRIGLGKDEVMAIGDSYNDVTMIRDCGLGVVMANAPSDVKSYGKHVTHCNNTDGVATAINRFALNV